MILFDGLLQIRFFPVTQRLMPIIAALLILLVMTAGFLIPETAQAGSRISQCGGKNQRPCNFWEAVPSCDANLVEDFLKGQCIARSGGEQPPPSASRPTDCGREGQRPCKLIPYEAFPSCEAGLAENFLDNKCVQPGGGTQLSDVIDLDPPNCQEIFAAHGLGEISTKALYNYKLFVQLPAEMAYEAVPKDTTSTPARLVAAAALYAVKYCGLTLERDVSLLNGAQ